MKICIAGEGAFANKHLDAIERIDGVDVVSLAGGCAEATQALARSRNIAHWTLTLDEALAQPGVAAVILATPTPMHARQAIKVLLAERHVLVEIPMADNLADAKALVNLQRQTDLVAMVNHTRRFNPGHQWIHNKIQAGELCLQQLDVQTHFFRRSNINALGQPRSWTDNLLWHHACHTVDLFQYQTGAPAAQIYAMQGPIHSELGIAMDMTIGMTAPSGAICNLSLSFNNEGPQGSIFRYICDNGTYIAHYDDLTDGYGNPIDLSATAEIMDGIELCDREFFAAIRDGREPQSSVAQGFSAMQTLDRLEQLLNGY